MASLEETREEIDRLDKDLVRLLAERMAAVRRIGSFKRSNPTAPLRDEERERVVFDAWAREAERAGLSPYFVGRVLREILNYSRRDQERLLDGVAAENASRAIKVGYQGTSACDADLAIVRLFASREADGVRRIGFATFGAALDALQGGDVNYVLLPVETTVLGSLYEVYDLLLKRTLAIVGEEVWPVEHCLVGLKGASAERISTIRSHPAALQQCQSFIQGLVGCTIESFEDTSSAGFSVMRDGMITVGAITSEEVAGQWGLTVLRRNISDHEVNETRFLLVGREAEAFDPRLPGKTALVAALDHRRGALLECLQAFDRHGLNLTKLESRPQPGAPWEYLFYIDIEGALSDPRVEVALEEARHHTNHLRILGSFPRRLDEIERERIASESPAVAETPTPAAPAVRAAAGRVVVDVGGVSIGGEHFILGGGPPPGQSRQQLLDTAAVLRREGVRLLRAGGPGEPLAGLDDLREAGRAYELPIIVEVTRPEDVALAAARADMLQIAAREMQNPLLLREVGQCHRPVLLRRGPSSTLDDLLRSAELITSQGNRRVVLCERGIRSLETATLYTIDLAAISILRARTSLPIMVDPTRAMRDAAGVLSLCLAAAAAGADGVFVEVRLDTAGELRRGLSPEELDGLVASMRPLLAALGRAL